MSSEYNSLIDQFPQIFEQYSGPINVGAGWLNLLKLLCGSIIEYSKITNNFQKIFILDVNKRFGGLHIEHVGGDDGSNLLVKYIERLSYNTCEECGNVGSLYSSNGTPYGKLATLCEKHSLVKYKKIYGITKNDKRNLS